MIDLMEMEMSNLLLNIEQIWKKKKKKICKTKNVIFSVFDKKCMKFFDQNWILQPSFFGHRGNYLTKTISKLTHSWEKNEYAKLSGLRAGAGDVGSWVFGIHGLRGYKIYMGYVGGVGFNGQKHCAKCVRIWSFCDHH